MVWIQYCSILESMKLSVQNSQVVCYTCIVTSYMACIYGRVHDSRENNDSIASLKYDKTLQINAQYY